jgi:hypothetical protein
MEASAGIDGRIILKFILTILDWIQLAPDKVQWCGSCGHDNETSGSVKGGEFFLLVEPLSASQEGLHTMDAVNSCCLSQAVAPVSSNNCRNIKI